MEEESIDPGKAKKLQQKRERHEKFLRYCRIIGCSDIDLNEFSWASFKEIIWKLRPLEDDSWYATSRILVDNKPVTSLYMALTFFDLSQELTGERLYLIRNLPLSVITAKFYVAISITARLVHHHPRAKYISAWKEWIKTWGEQKEISYRLVLEHLKFVRDQFISEDPEDKKLPENEKYGVLNKMVGFVENNINRACEILEIFEASKARLMPEILKIFKVIGILDTPEVLKARPISEIIGKLEAYKRSNPESAQELKIPAIIQELITLEASNNEDYKEFYKNLDGVQNIEIFSLNEEESIYNINRKIFGLTLFGKTKHEEEQGKTETRGHLRHQEETRHGMQIYSLFIKELLEGTFDRNRPYYKCELFTSNKTEKDERYIIKLDLKFDRKLKNKYLVYKCFDPAGNEIEGQSGEIVVPVSMSEVELNINLEYPLTMQEINEKAGLICKYLREQHKIPINYGPYGRDNYLIMPWTSDILTKEEYENSTVYQEKKFYRAFEAALLGACQTGNLDQIDFIIEKMLAHSERCCLIPYVEFKSPHKTHRFSTKEVFPYQVLKLEGPYSEAVYKKAGGYITDANALSLSAFNKNYGFTLNSKEVNLLQNTEKYKVLLYEEDFQYLKERKLELEKTSPNVGMRIGN